MRVPRSAGIEIDGRLHRLLAPMQATRHRKHRPNVHHHWVTRSVEGAIHAGVRKLNRDLAEVHVSRVATNVGCAIASLASLAPINLAQRYVARLIGNSMFQRLTLNAKPVKSSLEQPS